MTLVQCTSSHNGLSVCEVTCQYLQNCLSYAQHKKKWKRGITQKVLTTELWTLYMTLFLFKLYLYMKFHNNSIKEQEFSSRQNFFTKMNNSKNIDARVMDLVYDTSS